MDINLLKRKALMEIRSESDTAPTKFAKSNEELASPITEMMETDSTTSATTILVPTLSNATENELSALEKIDAESIWSNNWSNLIVERVEQMESKQKQVLDEETVVQKAMASAKTAMQVLNELVAILKLGTLKQEFLDTGLQNTKRFVCVLNIENNDGTDGETMEKYQSEAASSKKVALQDAARKVLAARFKIDPRIFDQIAADELKKSLINKDPISALYELCCRKRVNVGEQTFHRTVLTVGDKTYEGESSLSDADLKRITVIQLVQDVFGIDLSDFPLDNPKMETAHTTDTQFQHGSPVEALERFAAVTGVEVVYENVSILPKYGVKLTIGQGEAMGFGHTQDEAKWKAAVAILQQMGLGEFFQYPQAVEEDTDLSLDEEDMDGEEDLEEDESLDEQDQQYYPSHDAYDEDQCPYGWPQANVESWEENSEDHGQYWGDSYEQFPGYQSFYHNGGYLPPIPDFNFDGEEADEVTEDGLINLE